VQHALAHERKIWLALVIESDDLAVEHCVDGKCGEELDVLRHVPAAPTAHP
jgi:hypothetical protein